MEELDLNELFSYIWSKKLVILLIIVVFLTGSIVYSAFIQKPMYQSYTTILLTKEESNTAISYSDLNLNRSLVDTYSVIIKRLPSVVGIKYTKTTYGSLNLTLVQFLTDS